MIFLSALKVNKLLFYEINRFMKNQTFLGFTNSGKKVVLKVSVCWEKLFKKTFARSFNSNCHSFAAEANRLNTCSWKKFWNLELRDICLVFFSNKSCKWLRLSRKRLEGLFLSTFVLFGTQWWWGARHSGCFQYKRS